MTPLATGPTHSELHTLVTGQNRSAIFRTRLAVLAALLFMASFWIVSSSATVLAQGAPARAGQGQGAGGDATLSGDWSVQYVAPIGKPVPAQWSIRAAGNGFEAKDDDFVYAFTPAGANNRGQKFNFTITCALSGIGQINAGTCTLSSDGNQFEGEVADATGPIKLWTATRAGGSHAIPEGLYVQAGVATVRRGQKVSMPLFLRFNGRGQPPLLTNMNFDVVYRPQVAQVRAHPNPARQATAAANEQPELPRGNLLPGGVLIAGNTKEGGVVYVGFAGNKGIKPGIGRPGETVSEIYFEAVGFPGDTTELALHVTTANDQKGREVEVGVIPGAIHILDDRPPPAGPDGPGGNTGPGVGPGAGPGGGPGKGPGGNHPPGQVKPPPRTALDAYIALLMSVQRRPVEDNYDVDRDTKVTSRDSTKILQEAAATAGEGR